MLQQHGLDSIARPQARVRPLPRPPPMQGFNKAAAPSHREDTRFPILQADRPALCWDASAAVYTDGSKLDSLLLCAWVCPAHPLQGQYRVPGPAAELRTILQAELTAIHAAGHKLGISMESASRPIASAQSALCQHMLPGQNR